MRKCFALWIVGSAVAWQPGLSLGASAGTASAPPADGAVTKAVLRPAEGAGNLLKDGAWQPWQKGFVPQNGVFLCDNGADGKAQRGASQTVVLNQDRPRPIVASAWSRAEDVGGSEGSDYSLYLDLLYADGTPLWGQVAPFAVGSHDWQRREVVVIPDKPVKSLSMHLLLRGHTGKVFFREPVLTEIAPPQGACLFDGVPVAIRAAAAEGFQLRDVAAGGDFVRIEREALGLRLDCRRTERDGATFFDVTLADPAPAGRDRAVTLLYAVPLEEAAWQWCEGPRRTIPAEAGREYMDAGRWSVGANGRLSRWPLGAVSCPRRGEALAIDMAQPAFYRIGYNAATRELFIAFDLGLAAEKPKAALRFCRFALQPAGGLRPALARLYELFPDAFRNRIARQGLWMPFAKISAVRGSEDFGFAIKEGDGETKWDDEHGILTFRYTEPMTWWMRMPKELPRMMEAAVAEASRQADKGDVRAKAFASSVFHNERGLPAARFLDTPWCNGAVWSMNSSPGIAGEFTDFKTKWSPALRERLYGPKRAADLDGEYIDSSECYVTDDLDFRRDHFAAAGTPLTFSLHSRQVGVFKGLAVFEYVRGIAADVHGMGKYMMANGAPSRLCWLAPMLEVMGTETDWNPSGKWRPMGDGDLLYRRAICRGKPYCFLMNTQFERFGSDLVERYMKRCLAYGMFPGFFSHNASQGAYFTRPELYDGDRPLFRKYVPLCRLVAEAGWEPMTGAASSDERVYVERFGQRYLTVFNDSPDRRTVRITRPGTGTGISRELVSAAAVEWRPSDRSDVPSVEATLELNAEGVAVIDLALATKERQP